MVEPAFFVPVRPLLFSLGAARVHVNAFAASAQAAAWCRARTGQRFLSERLSYLRGWVLPACRSALRADQVLCHSRNWTPRAFRSASHPL